MFPASCCSPFLPWGAGQSPAPRHKGGGEWSALDRQALRLAIRYAPAAEFNAASVANAKPDCLAADAKQCGDLLERPVVLKPKSGHCLGDVRAVLVVHAIYSKAN